MPRALPAGMERGRGAPAGGAPAPGDAAVMHLRDPNRGPVGPVQVRPLGPVGALIALVAAVPLLLIGLVALATAMVFARKNSGTVRMWSFGGPVPGAPTPPAPGAGEPAPEAPQPEARGAPVV